MTKLKDGLRVVLLEDKRWIAVVSPEQRKELHDMPKWSGEEYRTLSDKYHTVPKGTKGTIVHSMPEKAKNLLYTDKFFHFVPDGFEIYNGEWCAFLGNIHLPVYFTTIKE